MIFINVGSVIFALFGVVLVIFDFLSLIFLPAVYYGLHYTCNDVDLVKITNIEKIDDFQCNIKVIGKQLNTTIYQVPCSIYDKIYDNKYNNTLVKFNHYNPNNCFDIVTSKEEFPKEDYMNDIKFINFIYFCWFLTIICGIGGFIMKRHFDYIDNREQEVGVRHMSSQTLGYSK